MRVEPVIAAGRNATKHASFCLRSSNRLSRLIFSFFDGGLPFESRSAQARPAERTCIHRRSRFLTRGAGKGSYQSARNYSSFRLKPSGRSPSHDISSLLNCG
jgi:hypothetical protein